MPGVRLIGTEIRGHRRRLRICILGIPHENLFTTDYECKSVERNRRKDGDSASANTHAARDAEEVQSGIARRWKVSRQSNETTDGRKAASNRVA